MGSSATGKKALSQYKTERAAHRAGKTSCRVQGRGQVAPASNSLRTKAQK